MAEQVSSTTLDEEVMMMMGKESGFSQVPAHGVFGGEMDVRAAKETEGLEKEDADSISEPVDLESPEEPDSTQMEDLISVGKKQEALRDQEQALNLMDLKQEEEEEDYGYDYEHKEPAPSFSEQNPVISSSATELLQAAFRPEPDDDEVKPAKNILDEDDDDYVVKPEKKEDVLLKTELEEQHQDFVFGEKVKEDIFASRFDQEKKAESLILEEKQEPESRNQVEERFRADSESTPAASASPTALVELLYWRDLKNSGIVFGASLLLLLSLSACSIISVLSYVALALLSVTISFRIYKGVLQAIQKSDEGHPFKLYLEQDVCLPEEVVRKYSDIALGRINTAIKELRRLFLVEDLVDSLKFAVLMWILTYVGALFNGLTLLIMGLVAMFTCPVVYEKHQEQIDHYISLVRNQVKDVVEKVQAKIPGAKKKAE
ncbi:reticulon-4b isoform X3 [Clarias gariepinus]|uniref:reticulon-4b isoform X3 n=1 Tax=Clarias gariepinus TaxID=13013 RepID=UPI00234E3483|nr:reticulon-4b isoform X3 [Clarias gariepinus]